MGTDIQKVKVALRERIRAALQTISPEVRVTASAQARALLKRETIWGKAQTILFFAPLPEELDIWPLLAEALADGKTVALPRFVSSTRTYAAARVQDLQRDIRTGKFGIREPAEHCQEILLGQVDLVLVPGMAFDLHGCRLGRGKGFYDQLLSAVRGVKCGVAFDEQIVSEVPATLRDERVSCILTPTRWQAVDPKVM